jgi:hypothetical protein
VLPSSLRNAAPAKEAMAQPCRATRGFRLRYCSTVAAFTWTEWLDESRLFETRDGSVKRSNAARDAGHPLGVLELRPIEARDALRAALRGHQFATRRASRRHLCVNGG